MKFCLIGEHLSHSYSQIVHSLRGVQYTLQEVPKGQLGEFVKNCPFDGFNITIPYKKDITAFVDEIDDSAKEIGAVNTVVRRDGKFIGYNTDTFGFDYMLKSAGITVEGKNVLILGSGGAGRMAEVYAKNNKAKSVGVVSRNGLINYSNVYEKKDTQIIVNATPVGMYPNNGECQIDLKKFPNLEAVADMIYNPLITEFMFSAKECGVKTVNGLPLLVAQAIRAQELWLNKTVTKEEIDGVCEKLLKLKQNIVLIGMPSSGKSEIGKKISKNLCREFVDIDEKIYNKEGITSAEIIQKFGEPAFREIESQVVKEFGMKNQLVIATGGGSVLREDNRKALKQNGIIVYIKRNLDLLVCDGRPISNQKGISTLFEERKGIYEGFADVTVENNSTIDNCVEELEKLI